MENVMKETLKYIKLISMILISLGIVLYILYPGQKYLTILSAATGTLILAISLIFSYRQTDWSGDRTAARKKTAAYLSIILLLAVIIMLQAIITRNNIRIDTTANRRFSLSDKTRNIIENLQSEINIICFYKDTDEKKQMAEDLVSNYIDLSDKISYEFMNPDRNPAVARRFKVRDFGVTVVESGGTWEKISDLTESKLTNSIYRAVSKKRLKIYFLTGHGEKSIHDKSNIGYSRLSAVLADENFRIRELSLSSGMGIPADCNVLIIAGPQKDILSFEKEAVKEYLEDNGRALFLIDPLTDSKYISDIVSGFGIMIENSIIVDRSGILTSGNYLTPVVNRYGDHKITRNFKYFSFFPQARSVQKLKTPDGIEVTPICFTNKNAYSESNIELVMEGKTQFNSGIDTQGPIPLAAVSAGSGGEQTLGEETRIGVFGDSDFASNKILDLYGNKDLIMNTINWLSRRENLISIRPRDRLVQPVLLTMRQGRLVNWLSMAVLPGIVIISGIFVISRRRKSPLKG